MAKIMSDPLLFCWDFIEEMPDIQRVKLVLDNLPDEGLMKKLEEKRGGGRAGGTPVRIREVE